MSLTRALKVALLALSLFATAASAQSYNYHPAAPARPVYRGPAPVVGYRGPVYGGRYYYGGGYGYGRGYYSLGYGYGTPYPYSRYYWGWGYRYYPQVYASAPLPPAYMPATAPVVVATVGLEGQLVQGGLAAGGNLIVEGQRLGFVADFNNFFVGPTDGTPQTLQNSTQYRTFDAHMSYALISDPHGRLRLEGGVDSMFLPNAVLVGPGLGVSGGLGLFGPVGLEGAVRVTPWPYHELDATAGLTLGLGPVGVRGGWRYTVLDDNGLVDGTDHSNSFAGPYVGLAVSM
jgi:hypothetical protein